jgi:hypothetical protein
VNFTYRATMVDRATGRLKNIKTVIDTETWQERITNPAYAHLYGNTKEVIEGNLDPYKNDGDVETFYAALMQTYEAWKKANIVILFEYAMYMWAEFNAGRISSKVWAAVLGVAWQSGARGMMACVVLTASQVKAMFKAADLETLHNLVGWKGEDLNKTYANLPDTLTVYRGVSTGIEHFEDGLSWTRDMREPLRFAVLNCQTKKEIPGFITATIRKEAVLALFSFEQEVVVDPSVPKVEVRKEFLRGNELRKFHKQFDVEANARSVVSDWMQR